MKLRSGLYWADFYLSNGSRVRKSLKTRDRTAAVSLERELMAAEELRLRQEPTRIAVAASKQGGVGVSLSQAYRRALREHPRWRDSPSPRTITENYEKVAAKFGADCPLADITTDALLSWSEEMRAAGLAPSTINQRLSLVSVIFKRARTWADAPGLTRPEIIRSTPREGRIRRITHEEEAKLVAYFSTSGKPKHMDMAALVVVLVDSGLRLSEALRMSQTHGTGTHIDLDMRVLRVYEAKAKNPSGVPMTDRVHDILAARTDLEFPFGMFTVDSADDAWALARASMQLSEDAEFVIHALRHTTASRLVQAGVDTATVQRFMRHKNIATTMKYVHLEVEDLRGAAKALQNVPKSVPKTCPKVGVSPPEGDRQDSVDIPGGGVDTGLPHRDPCGAPDKKPRWLRTVNPQVPGSSPGRGATHTEES